ncbi:RloB domain-containing protein [Treponema zioleckii]|uniref:RloB domain-containing protein n=1 Tax=Treponema zioleckii TaxID=331680 RepID=UPI00168A6E50|nr:RloB domain-containing protein [Treponema zioleckii]
MPKKSRPNRKMKPVILVLCEGETEECYIDFLKQKYRLPIKIVSKIVGSKINTRLIRQYKKELAITNSENINCFLMYDADVQSVVDNLKTCEEKLLLSRPCIEVWFLAHTQRVPDKTISSEECVNLLKKENPWKDYKKGNLSFEQQELLWENRISASQNIKQEQNSDKPFSMMKDFIDLLEDSK